MSTSDIKHYKITEPWLHLNMGLGEAPYWHEPTNTLRFSDIVKRHFYQVDLTKGPESLKKLELSTPVTTTAEIAHGDGKHLVFGGKSGVGLLNRETGEWRQLAEYWDEGKDKAEKVRRFRGNDGAVDAKGRYFVGVMNDPSEAEIENEGTLFRLDPDLSLHTVKHPVAIPNGTSWTLDNKYIYTTDSPSGKIMKHPYNLETGDIDWENGTTFFTCPIEGGVPDGHAQDADGCFWVALFGTGKVVRVNTEGQIIADIELPTRCVTCPGIAGEDLYITSAEEESPKEHPESTKYQGSVFKLHIGVKGAPLHEFKPSKPLF